MKWNVLRNALALVGMATIVYRVLLFAWPLMNSSDIIVNGSYRSIRIGSGKAEVADLLLSARSGNGRLKVIGYLDPVTDERVSIVFGKSDYDLIDASVWFLAYPSIHREYIELTFEDDSLTSIRYNRGILSP